MNTLTFGLATKPLLRVRKLSTTRTVCSSHPTVRMSEVNNGRSVLICDVLDTLVADPFSRGMHTHFGFSTMKEFLAAKTPHAWIKFELGEYDEAALAADFFKDKRHVDIDGFKKFLLEKYRLLPGVAELLTDLRAHDVPVHLCSNYGPWHTLIEQVVGLQRDYGTQWTFVSSQQRARKPHRDAYERVAKIAQVPASQCVLLDDRSHNCDGALVAGYRGAVRFDNAAQARQELAPFFGDWLLDSISK